MGTAIVKPYVFYEMGGMLVSYVSSLTDFYEWFDMCGCCLVKNMCIDEEEVSERVKASAHQNYTVKVKRPCESFIDLVEGGMVINMKNVKSR